MTASAHRSSLRWPALVVLLGLSASYFAWHRTRQAEEAEASRLLLARARAAAERFEDYAASQGRILRLLRGLYALDDPHDDGHVRVLVNDVVGAESGHVALRYLCHASRVPAGGLPAFVAAQRQLSTKWAGVEAHDFDGAPAAPADRHDVIDHLWPADDNPLVLGLDLAAEPACREALDRATAGGDVALSRPFRMADAGPGGGRTGVLLALPIYAPDRPLRTAEQRAAALAGFAISVYDVEHMLRVGFARDTALEGVPPARLEVSESAGRPIGAVGPAVGESAASVTELLYLFDRTWVLHLRSPGSPGVAFAEFAQRTSTILPVAILVTMGLTAGIVWMLMRRTMVIQQQVAAQTAEMREKTLALERKEAELNDANRRLLEMSHTDPLTGILNRRAFELQLEKERERSLRTGVPFGLLIFDVDFFKGYNDRYGHVAGDEVLRRVAQIIHGEARRIDSVARYGGEEFVVLATGSDAGGLLALGERIRSRIQEAGIENQASPFGVITISGGGALLPPRADTGPRQLVETSDRCLYQAKSTGRNRIVMVA